MQESRRDLWSPASKQDLRDIWVHFAKLASPEVADNLLREIDAAGILITQNPLAWQPHDELLPGVRIVPAHPYAIFYRLVEHTPQILRVLHQRRNYSAALRTRRD